MTIGNGIVLYVILWWIALFCVLPLGVTAAGNDETGGDPGAPSNPRLAYKALLATGIAAVLFAIVYAIVLSDIISFRRME